MPKTKIGRPRKESSKVNLKQEKFIENYINTGNATQSAIVAGYSENSASVAGYRLLQNEAVVSVISSVKRDIAKELVDKAHIAYDVLQDIMLDNNVSAKVRSDVASNLLDRAGYKATEKKKITGSVTGSISNTITFELVQRTRELLNNKANTVDIEGAVMD